ncbi:hypothetical protein FOA52_014162 [Chlamydomonas sp. UWO 241]|nr:hypothetical protein FOA52_014162 [Chlamydomonas sp. UWO 241]
MVHRRHRVSEANAEALWEGKLPPPPEPINWVRWHINFSIKLAITGICAFAIGVLIIIQLDVGDPQLTAEFHAQVSQEAYSWPMVAFITAFSLNFVTLLFERDSSKMQLALLACYINLLAAASDCLAWKGYAPIVRDVWGGGLQLVRVYMWLLTTPAMVYLLSIISDFRWQRVQLVMLADVTMLVFGIAADLAPSLPVAVVLYVIATCLFLFVMSEMAMMFEAAIADTQSVRGQHNLLVLKRVTVGLWFAFPATFMITKLGLVSLGMEEWMWTVGDFAGKVTFSCSLMYGNFLTIEQRRLIAMRIVEEGNRIQVIQELNDLVEQKERFMSSMSHELRTPLNGIIGLSEAVLVGSCGKLPEQAQKTVGTIKTSGARLLTLVNDILDAASMRVNKLVVKHERVNMHNLVNDVVEMRKLALRPSPPRAMGTRSKTLKDLNNLNLMALGAGMAAIAADAAAAAGGAGAGEESMEGVIVVAGTPSPRACLLTPGRGTRGATNAEVPSSAMSSPVRAPADHDEMHMGIPPPDPSAAMHRGMRELLREEFAEQRDLIREEFSRGMAALAARVTETEARVAGVIAAVATLDARITSKFAQADVAFGPLLRLVPELSVAKDGVADLDERMGRMEKHEVLALAQFHVDQGKSREMAAKVAALTEQVQALEAAARGGRRRAGRQTRTSWRSPKPGIPLCQPLAKRAVTLVNAIDEGAAHVLGDTGRIIQVFHNLIGNSCKFTNAGSVTVSTATVGDFLEVSVSDTGIGIPESRFEQIFNAFEQVDMSTTRQYGGTGLGLNLVKQLVEAHGGTIRIATSKLGVGTTFTFQLWLWDARERARFPGEDRVAPPPAAAAAVSAATAAAAESAAAAAVAAKAKKGGWGGKGNDPAITAGWGGAAAAAPAVVPAITLQRQGSANGAELSPMPLRVNPRRLPMRFASTLGAAAKAPTARNRKIRVLSVDDDPVNQMVIESLLTPDQYEIMQAMDGLEALQMLDNARNEPPDIILLDVMMPGMSGYEVCSQLRKRDPYNCIPIIMVSAKSKEEHIVEGLAAGSNDYMVKPFGRLEILARIASHVRFRNSVYTAGAEDMSARTAQASVTLERISRIESQQYSLPPSLKSAVEGGQWSHVSPLPRPATLLVVRVANLDEIQNELLACEVFSAVSAFLVNAEPTLEKHGAYVISGLESRLMIACGLDGGAAAGAAGAAAGTEPVQQALALARDLQVLAATMVIDECVGLRLRLAIGIHQTSVADGAVVGVEYPHLQVVGSMAMEAASVEGLAAAGCITVSAPVQKALAGSVEFAPADDLGGHVGQVYLVKEGHWQEGLKEMPLLLKMLKERRDGAPNASAKRLGPVQLALLLLLRQIEPHKLLRSGGPRAQAQPGPGSADMPHAIQALAAAGESVFGRSTFGGIGRSSAGGTPHPHPFPAWGSHGGGSHGGSVAAARDAATLAEKALLESQLEEVSIECARLQQVVDELEARELAAKAALSARAAAAPPTPTSGGGGPETEALRARAAAFEEQAATLESQLDEAEGSLLAAHQEKRALAAELNAIRVAAGLVPGTNPRERRPVRGGLSIGSTLPRGGFNRFEVKLHTNSSSQLPYLPRDVSSLLFDAPGAAVGSPAYEHHRGGSGTGSGSACGRDSPALSTGTATIILVEGAAEIAAMLSSAGLAHLVPKFVSEDLTADMVLHLDDATLKQLGVASIGARMRLRAMCGGGGQSVQQ